MGLQDITGQLINTSHQNLNWKMAFSLLWPEALFKCTQRGRDGWSGPHTGMPCHLSRRTDSQGQNQSDYQWDPSPFKAQETHISWNAGREMRGVIIIWSICNFFALLWGLGSYSFDFLGILSSIKIIKMKFYRIASTISRSKMPNNFYSLKNTLVRGHTLNVFYIRIFLL